jgi:hypothetical protein
MNSVLVAAIIFVVATIGAAGFQCALALGAPWGAYAMGGRFPGRLPAYLRIAAVMQAVMLGVLAVVVMIRAGLALPAWASVASGLIWIVVGFSAVSLVLNAMTPSRGERRLWVPVACAMLASSLVVALSG